MKNLAIVCINYLTLNVKRIHNPRLRGGGTANNRMNLAPNGIDTFSTTTLIPTLQNKKTKKNKQTNKQTSKQAQMVSAFKVPKGETKVWAIATATLPWGHESKQALARSNDSFIERSTHSLDSIHSGLGTSKLNSILRYWEFFIWSPYVMVLILLCKSFTSLRNATNYC